MSNISMSIELDRPDRTYAPGEEVKGTAIIQTDRECTCSGLSVRMQ
ncbi:MAG: hypothetical protein JXA09_10915 [Anaerolineae bacterium]|nr:hypothetical protein [Anaerolineae bacterium]